MADSSTTGVDSQNIESGNVGELASMIQGVLQQTQDRFQHMSDTIIRRIDDMTKRIDDLEKNISDLMAQNQVDQPPTV
ncbi:unnamed protein product [Caenorhabditis bovis]|uniref:Heat shock factor-binding protein 1 n=1 Tax=Caenorhabditis bovis TaxID=2654633 RepID=A0A8S1F6L0_9PELO|nr:unnamed protein product [Caenorhabditis bovis]